MGIETIQATGGDRSSPDDWYNNLPGSINSGSEHYRGQMANETFSGVMAVDSAKGTGSTFTARLECQAGAAWYDNATKLEWNASDGAVMVSGAVFANCINVSDAANDYFEFVGILFDCRTWHHSRGISATSNSTDMKVDRCFFKSGHDSNTTYGAISTANSPHDIQFTNSIVYGIGPNFATEMSIGNTTGMSFIHCLLAISSADAPANTLMLLSGGTVSGVILKNCAVLGYDTFISGAITFDGPNSGNNASDFPATTMPGSNNQEGITYNATTPLTDADDNGGYDLRAIAGAELENNGAYVPGLLSVITGATFLDTDVFGTTRSQTTPDIGPYELAGAPPPVSVPALASKSARGTVPLGSY